jgi:hypothetical protein
MVHEINPVQDLHVACVRELRAYIAEANQTCKLLLGVKGFPIPPNHRIAMLEQRQRENIAYDRYQDARRRLFEAAKWK